VPQLVEDRRSDAPGSFFLMKAAGRVSGMAGRLQRALSSAPEPTGLALDAGFEDITLAAPHRPQRWVLGGR
jgi:hypothetical protein